jgi:hypothetical protein
LTPFVLRRQKGFDQLKILRFDYNESKALKGIKTDNDSSDKLLYTSNLSNALYMITHRILPINYKLSATHVLVYR